MNPTETPTAHPTQPDPTQDRPGPAVPESLAAILRLIQILLGYGRRLAQTAADSAHAAHPRFATVAVAAGTHDLPVILARIQRGILRLLALDSYLRNRAQKGREIALTEPRTHKPSARTEDPQISADVPKPRKRRPAYDPNTAHIPTLEELEAEVRRTPIGRTIARVCLDLAIIPAFCTGEIWNAIFDTLQNRGGSLRTLYAVRRKREKTFQRERDARPHTWDWDWRDLRKTTVRQVIGWLIGEQPALDPPECLAIPC